MVRSTRRWRRAVHITVRMLTVMMLQRAAVFIIQKAKITRARISVHPVCDAEVTAVLGMYAEIPV
jgi:hypothetical protein